jgi:hypothetical protein
MSIQEAEHALISFFLRSGYVRRFDPERRKRENQAYKKGYEVRLVVASRAELRAVRRRLKTVRLRPGRPYPKHGRIVQPVYGRAGLDWFMERLPADWEKPERRRRWRASGLTATPRSRRSD